MIRPIAGLAILIPLLAACATDPGAAQNRDVSAVVQDEASRQAVAEGIQEGKSADQALAGSAEARAVNTEVPH